LQATLERIANGSGKTTEEFVLRLVEDFLIDEYKREVIKKVENSTFEEIKQLDTVVTEKKEEIATIKAEAEQAKIAIEKPVEEPVEEIILDK